MGLKALLLRRVPRVSLTSSPARGIRLAEGEVKLKGRDRPTFQLKPLDHLRVQLTPAGAARQRRIRFAATGQRSAATLGALAARLSDQGRTGAQE